MDPSELELDRFLFFFLRIPKFLNFRGIVEGVSSVAYEISTFRSAASPLASCARSNCGARFACAAALHCSYAFLFFFHLG